MDRAWSARVAGRDEQSGEREEVAAAGQHPRESLLHVTSDGQDEDGWIILVDFCCGPIHRGGSGRRGCLRLPSSGDAVGRIVRRPGEFPESRLRALHRDRERGPTTAELGDE